MMTTTRTNAISPLISPDILLAELPITPEIATQVARTRREIEAIFSGEDSRLLVVVGPCSIHDPQAALLYASKLQQAREQFATTLCIIMRIYFEKPRTSVGWKGLINDPHLDNSFDINNGLRTARRLLLEINQLGLPAATEFLDTIIPPFISDLISWGAIGARTTESQIHRQLASGQDMPIGFKNSTSGNVQVAINAVRAAMHPHQLLGIDQAGRPTIFSTLGNEHCHVILRGGWHKPNYDAATLAEVQQQLIQDRLPPYLMVDCSHGNSQQIYLQQAAVVNDLCQQIENGNSSIAGTMIESHLVEGNQHFVPGKKLTFGQSITDACLSWDQTLPLLTQLAEVCQSRQTATLAS